MDLTETRPLPSGMCLTRSSSLPPPAPGFKYLEVVPKLSPYAPGLTQAHADLVP
jgi:hypothetical protein